MSFHFALSLIVAATAFGKFRTPGEVPVKRLIENLEAQIKSEPGDPKLRYILARTHYLAFATGAETLAHFESPPYVGDFFHVGKAGQPVQALIAKVRLAHLITAVAGIQDVLSNDQANGLYALTAACIYEDGAPFAPELKQGESSSQWIEHALRYYRQAHELGWKTDSTLEQKPLKGINSLISYEAGLSYLRLVAIRGPKPDERGTISLVLERTKHISGLPFGAITPIVLSLNPHRSLDELLAPDLQTTFDLDGTARPQTYPWLQPTAGLLVWDPAHTGTITSGCQLFGSVTWWMFWNNGYEALAALDDNRDGWLTGAELEGLAVWFDRNQNGLSDPGEVVPVHQLNIDAINVKSDSRDGVSWKSSQGLRLRDGSILPTWDWVVSQIGQTIPSNPTSSSVQ